jgi:hypothetical protein
MINRCDDATYLLAAGISTSGPPVNIRGGEYTLFVEADQSFNGTLSLQQRSLSGAWIDCEAYGLQYVRTTEFQACIAGILLPAGTCRIKAEGQVLNLKAHLVGAG